MDADVGYTFSMANPSDRGAQNLSLVVFGLFIESYSTLHLFQNTFYRIKVSCF